MSDKVIIFSAPSGSGKTTIVQHLLKKFSELEFSVSATSRAKREGETHGKDYYFLTLEDFKLRLDNDEFIEYEEVYSGRLYGTLKSEAERIWAQNKIIIFDVDVKGGMRLKETYGDKAMAVFIMPPSLEELQNRLILRSTECLEDIEKRVARAEEEISYAGQFDKILVNDNLDEALKNAEEIVCDWINS